MKQAARSSVPGRAGMIVRAGELIDYRDVSYLDKAEKLSASDYQEHVASRRRQVDNFLALLPHQLTDLPNVEFAGIGDAKIQKTLAEIEKLEPTWVHKLTDEEGLGRLLDETTAEIWRCSRATGAFLNMLIRMCRPEDVLELGTSVGYSTLWMAAACKQTGAKITTVEYLASKVDLAQHHFDVCGLDGIVTLVHDDILNVLENWHAPSPGLVFMDPNKEWQEHYLRLLMGIMKPGSVIVTDNAFDYHDISEGYVRTLREGFSSLFTSMDSHGTLVSVRNG